MPAAKIPDEHQLDVARAASAGQGAFEDGQLDVVLDVLEAAAEAYYHTDSLVLDDATYDALVRRVSALAIDDDRARRVLGQVAGGTQAAGDVAHSEAMLSLDNAMDDSEFAAWHDRLVKLVGEVPLVVEPKLDGLAAACRYEQGVLVQVITRGDGQRGEDVTAQALGAYGLPERLSESIDIEVRGEVYLTAVDFEAANAARTAAGKPKYVNRRNGAAGALRNQSGSAVQLSFAAYALGPGGAVTLDAQSHSGAMRRLGELGVATAGALVDQGQALASLDEATRAVRAIEAARPTLSFDIDGAVIKADRHRDQDQAGATSRAPRWAIARKFVADSRETVLCGISVEVGRTGALSFTAELEPVFVGGATISRATLHNVTDLQRRVGVDGVVMLPARVWVHRAGDVIPEIVGLSTNAMAPDTQTRWEPPTACPRCGGALDTVSVVWRCAKGRACNASANLTYACSRDALDIEGLSGKAIARLVEAGLVSDLADLYELDVQTLASIDRLGETSAAKILANLESAKTAPLSRVLTALGIRFIGRRPARWLAAAAGSMERLRTMTVSELALVDGIGPTRAESAVAELSELSGLIDRLSAVGFTMIEPQSGDAQAQSGPLAGKTVVVSGTVAGMTRDQARAAVEALGGKSSSSVSTKTDLLVCGPGAGAKRQQAESLGVEVMDSGDFAALVQANGA